MSRTRSTKSSQQKNLEQLLDASLFKALADPVRVAIVAQLACKRDPSTVSSLNECCGIDFSGVSRHLKQLKDAGVLSANKVGRETHYQLDSHQLAENLRALADALEKCSTKAC